MSSLLNQSLRDHFIAVQTLCQQAHNTVSLPGLKCRRLRKQVKENRDIEIPIPKLNHPPVEDAEDFLAGFSLSLKLLVDTKRLYQQSLQQIRQLQCLKFEQSCREIVRSSTLDDAESLPLIFDKLHKVYERRYLDWFVPELKEEIISHLGKFTSTSTSNKVAFNTEFTPLLEKYFKLNAYPSAPDRRLLAQKTAMTPRQIEVWFQNHRKRAKSSGKPVNRMSPNMSQAYFPVMEQLDFTSAVIIDSPSGTPLHAQGRDSTSKNSTVTTGTTDLFSTIDSDTTSRVFPSRFSPLNAAYNFHSDSVFHFPAPVWARTRATAHRASHSPIDFDEFASLFASKLCLRDGSSRSTRKSSHHTRSKQEPWFYATTTTPSCAPHPACIQAHTASISNFNIAISGVSPSRSNPIHAQVMSRLAAPTKKPAPFPKRYPSTFHPYWRARSCRSTLKKAPESLQPFAGKSVSRAHMPTRSNSITSGKTTSTSWVALLESMPTRSDPLTSTTPEYSGTRVDSSSSSVSSIINDANTPSSSRSSSLSSLDSSLPVSPVINPLDLENCGFAVSNQTFDILDSINDLDQFFTGFALPSLEDMPFSKPDNFSPLTCLQTNLSTIPLNYIQLL